VSDSRIGPQDKEPFRLTLHRTQVRNVGTGNFECAPNEDLFGDLKDAGGNVLAPYWIQLISHS